jgi:hypothetical protein
MPCPCTGRSAQRHYRRWSAATGSRTRVLRRSRRLRSRTELLRACVPWSYSPPLPGIANTPSGHPKQFVEMMSQFGGFPCGRRASEVFGLSCLSYLGDGSWGVCVKREDRWVAQRVGNAPAQTACLGCDRKFAPRRAGHIFCSARCRHRAGRLPPDERRLSPDPEAVRRLFDPKRNPGGVRADDWPVACSPRESRWAFWLADLVPGGDLVIEVPDQMEGRVSSRDRRRENPPHRRPS